MNVLRTLFSLKGRVNIRTFVLALIGTIAGYFIWFLLLTASIGFGAGILDVLGIVSFSKQGSILYTINSFCAGICLIPFAWMLIAIQTKRWHDQDKSGWNILVWIIPIIGPLIALYNLFIEQGTPGPNKFGLPQGYEGQLEWDEARELAAIRSESRQDTGTGAIVLEVIGKELTSTFPTFTVKKSPGPTSLASTDEALALTAAALFYRNYANFAREMRAVLYDIAISILDTGKVPSVPHRGILKQVTIRLITPFPRAYQLHFKTKPTVARDERALQASVAAATTAYLAYVLSHPGIDRAIFDFTLSHLAYNHPKYANLDWLPTEVASEVQQLVTDHWGKLMEEKSIPQSPPMELPNGSQSSLGRTKIWEDSQWRTILEFLAFSHVVEHIVSRTESIPDPFDNMTEFRKRSKETDKALSIAIDQSRIALSKIKELYQDWPGYREILRLLERHFRLAIEWCSAWLEASQAADTLQLEKYRSRVIETRRLAAEGMKNLEKLGAETDKYGPGIIPTQEIERIGHRLISDWEREHGR